MAFLLVFATAFVLALALTPLGGRLGRRYGFVAVPGGRRRHVGRVPRPGGIALYAAFVTAVLLASFVCY